MVVQSPSSSPAALDGHIESWMTAFREELEKLTPEEFGNHILALEAQKLEKDKRLSEESYRHWGEIVERRLEFGRDQKEVEALRQLTQEQLLAFWDERLAQAAPLRRKLATHVYSQKHKGERLEAQAVGPDVTLIETLEDLRAFKRGLPLFPGIAK